MSKAKPPISKVLVCLPKPLWANAGIIWSISGAILQNTKCYLDEYQFWYLVIPSLFNRDPYLLLVSSKLLDLEDVANVDRAILLRAAQAFPTSLFVIWDKEKLWEPTDSPNPANVLVWTDPETGDVTKKILSLLGVQDDGPYDLRRSRK